MKDVPLTESRYKAKTFSNSTIDIKTVDLPLKLHQMIVWAMMKPEDAMHLIPEYDLLRSKCDWRDESQKTHCGRDI